MEFSFYSVGANCVRPLGVCCRPSGRPMVAPTKRI